MHGVKDYAHFSQSEPNCSGWLSYLGDRAGCLFFACKQQSRLLNLLSPWLKECVEGLSQSQSQSQSWEVNSPHCSTSSTWKSHSLYLLAIIKSIATYRKLMFSLYFWRLLSVRDLSIFCFHRRSFYTIQLKTAKPKSHSERNSEICMTECFRGNLSYQPIWKQLGSALNGLQHPQIPEVNDAALRFHTKMLHSYSLGGHLME